MYDIVYSLHQVGLLLNDNDPLTLHWNSSVPNHLCVMSNYTGPLYGHDSENRLSHMNYTICKGPDPLKVWNLYQGGGGWTVITLPLFYQ